MTGQWGRALAEQAGPWSKLYWMVRSEREHCGEIHAFLGPLSAHVCGGNRYEDFGVIYLMKACESLAISGTHRISDFFYCRLRSDEYYLDHMIVAVILRCPRAGSQEQRYLI
jgi:hypothetical protein